MRIPSVVVVSLIWILLITSAVDSFAAMPQQVEISVSMKVDAFNVEDRIMLDVRYFNKSASIVELLIWDTVLEGRIDTNLLSVFHEGVRLPYVGRIYKRPQPQPSDFIQLQPGEERVVAVDLLTGYAVNYQGVYKVALNVGANNKIDDAISFTLTEDRPIQFKRAPIITSCNTSQSSQIDSALSAAESIARIARDSLRETPVSKRSQARRYSEWFGEYSEGRWNFVQDHFNRIFSAVSGRVLTFECDSTSSAYAYVYKNRPYEIFLGRAFWRAPRTGTDSKAGTIIHELSHFDVLGGTDDHVYGQSAARSLAKTNPGRAVDNADNHEYFAENTPSLPMLGSESFFPDLVVGGITLSKKIAIVNSLLNISTSVSNSGNLGSAVTQLVIKLSVDEQISMADTEISRVPFTALASGQEQSIELAFRVPETAGRYWIGVCILPVSGELSTNNNCSQGRLLDVIKLVPLAPILMLLEDDD